MAHFCQIKCRNIVAQDVKARKEARRKVIEAARKLEGELTFGVGYFTDRAHLASEAQAYVSDEELQKGIKAYFVQHNYTVEEEGKTVEKAEILAVPLAYPQHLRLSVELIYGAAQIISPDEYTTKIRRAIQLETRKAPILRRAQAA